MSATPREIGTLIVVVLKGNHLPNKRHIGKQDPYCVVAVNGEKRRTKAIKRGGQHPEWDEEIRFTLFEDVDDVLQRTAHGDRTPPPPPPKDNKGTKSIKGGKIMKLACYADDPREPDLIGEADVDLTEVLTKGETDEWFTLMSKEKFAGKIYLELTFWSNEPPPEKKVARKPPKENKQYAGPGSFIPSGESPSSVVGGQASRVASASGVYDHSRQNSDSIPLSLRASSSLARLDLYVPPYEQRNRLSSMERVTNEFSELGVSEHNRRDGYSRNDLTYRSPSTIGISASTYVSHGFEPSTQAAVTPNPYIQTLNPTGRSVDHHSSLSDVHSAFQPHPSFQTQYEAGTPYHQPLVRGPRHSTPTSSSGFVPFPTPSTFHPSESSSFVPPLSHTPSLNYNSTPYSQSGFSPPQTSTPSPYLPQSIQPSQSFTYQYGAPPSTPGPDQHYIVSQPPASVPPQSHSTPPQVYPSYATTPSPSQGSIPVSSLSVGSSSSLNGGSRPLPQQPQIVYAQQPVQAPPSGSPQAPLSYSPEPNVSVANSDSSFTSPPPPPPPPPNISQFVTGQQTYSDPQHANLALPLPPPPPPPSMTVAGPSRRRTSLPQPPVNYQQPSSGHPLPLPPPPPPAEYLSHIHPPPPPPPIQSVPINHSQPFYPGPPPRPPVAIDAQGQWMPQNLTYHSPLPGEY